MITAPIGPLTRILMMWPVGLDVADARQTLEDGGRDRRREGQLDVVEGELADGLDPVDLDEAALADDGDPVTGAVDLVDDVRRQEDGPAVVAGLADEPEERLLDERVEARGRLVEDEQVRPVLERDDQPDLLLVAPRVLLVPPARVEVERLDQLRDVRLVDAAAQVAEVRDRLGAGQSVVQVELAGQVADATMDRDRIGGRLDAEDLGAAGGRPDQVEQDAHRGRLAGAVRSQEPEDLALGDLQIEVDDPPVLPVGLGQSFGLDDGGHITSLRRHTTGFSTRPSRLRAPRRRRNGRDRSTSAAATAVVSGTARTIPMLPTTARTTSTAIDLARRGQERVLATGSEQHDERQRGADVGKEQGVDRGRDVRPADVHGPRRQDHARQRRAGLVELADRGGLGERHVVEDAERSEDDPGEEQPADVDVRQADGLEVGGILRPAELGEPRELVEHERETRDQRQRRERADPGGEGLRPEALGQQEGRDGDPGRGQDRDPDRIAAGQDQRDDDLDDHHEGQRERDQRPDAAPAADDRHRDREDPEQDRQDRDAIQVADGDDLAIGLLRGVDDDLVADVVARQVLGPGRPLEEPVDRLARPRTGRDLEPDIRARRVGRREELDDRAAQQLDGRWLRRRWAQVRDEEDDPEQEDEAARQRACVSAQTAERDLDRPARLPDPRCATRHVAGFEARWAASARSFRTRRCASTRLASEARPRRTRIPVQRSNGSNVAAWMTFVPPATGSSRQLHSLSKPDAVTRTRKRESGRASRLSTCAASRNRPSRVRAERVVAAAGQAGAAGPSRSSGNRTAVPAGSWSVAQTVRGEACTKTRRSTAPLSA